MKAVVAVIASVLATSTVAATASPVLAQGVQPTPEQLSRFRLADLDGNGFLDLAEARGVWADMTPREFEVYDSTDDGLIDPLEFISIRLSGPVIEEGDRGGDRVDEAALEFRQLDLDASGGITPAELLEKYPEAAASFDALDLDGDGVLSEGEFTGEAAR